MACREMSKGSSRCFQPTAKAQSRRLPVESAMPGTTLQTIELKAFASGGALFGESTILGFDVLGCRALHLVVPCLVSPQSQGLCFEA